LNHAIFHHEHLALIDGNAMTHASFSAIDCESAYPDSGIW
jgi:hypothetical protein